MENNNQDLRPDELTPDEVENQDVTYAEDIPEAVNNKVAEVAEETEEVEVAEEAEEVEEADVAEVAEEVEEADVAEVAEVTEEVTEDGEDAALESAEESPEERAKRKRAFLSALYDYAEIFAISIIAVIVVFSFCFRLCQVDGHSMQNTLEHNERIVAYDLFYTPKQGDIIVFHLVNDTFHRPLVKRVIATEGQTVEINYTDKKIYVDGVLYDDKHAYVEGGDYVIKFDFDVSYMSYEDGKLYYRATVPEDKVFVLGDNRNNSTDSRSTHVGFVDEDCILGKAILRLSPFTVFD